MAEMDHSQWRGKTEGSDWMHRTLIRAFKFLNLNFVYAGMAVFVIPFYMLFAHQGYISIYHFFRRRMGFRPLKAFCYVYANHVRFGQVVLDRFAAYAGMRFQYDIEGYDLFQEQCGHPEGFVIFSSHTGNYEIAGYAFSATEKPYNALVFSGEAETVMENRNRVLSEHHIKMIPVSEDMSHIFLLNNALRDGEIVSIPGDRIFGSPKYVTCRLFGKEAKFPFGPYALAVQRGVKAFGIFTMKTSSYRYKIYVRPLELEDRPYRNSKEKAQCLAQLFADEIENIIRRYPTQWFNFFEFWDQ